MTETRFQPFTISELRALISAIVAAQHQQLAETGVLGSLRHEAATALEAKLAEDAE